MGSVLEIFLSLSAYINKNEKSYTLDTDYEILLNTIIMLLKNFLFTYNKMRFQNKQFKKHRLSKNPFSSIFVQMR